MAQQTGVPFRAKIMAKIPKARDLELHVRVAKIDGLELVDLRDYIPSLKQYGRGVQFEGASLGRVIEELRALHPHVGTGNGSRKPGGNQPAML